MTTRLQEAIRRAEALPPGEQDRIADLVLDGIGDADADRRWDERFAETADGLEKLALRALERDRRGESVEKGWDEL